MPQTRKIATCCYCGTRSVLVLDRARHELACAACGAPLHDMKALPAAAPAPRPRQAPAWPDRPAPRRPRDDRRPARGGKRKGLRAGKLGRKILEEIWDVVEDILD